MFKITETEIMTLSQAAKIILVVLGSIKKRQNAYETHKKMKENGTYPGRNKIRDDKLIRKLRKNGLSMRAIAKIACVSTTAVHRSINEEKTKDI